MDVMHHIPCITYHSVLTMLINSMHQCMQSPSTFVFLFNFVIKLKNKRREQFNVQALGFSMFVKHGQNPARKETLGHALQSIEEVYCDVAVKLSGNIAVHVLFLYLRYWGRGFP